jgi:adenylosuccinate synthase
MEEGSGAAVGWLTATLEWRLRAGGGANALHGCVPTDRGGGATDVWS